MEMEIKLKIPDKLTAKRICEDPQILRYAQEAFSIKQMESVYYDTPVHALNQRKWAMRIRRENEKSVAAFKRTRPEQSDKGVFIRDEWECEAQSPREAVERLVEAGAPEELRNITAGTDLVERCRVVFTRNYTVLRLPNGLVCELSLDDGVIQAGGKIENLLELELEILFGESSQAADLSAEWMKKYGLTYEYAGKYERALRLIRTRI